MSIVPGWPSTIPLPTQALPDEAATPTAIELLNELPFNKLPSVSNHTSTFTCFPNLPLELRLTIWKLTFPPRIITLTYRQNRCFQPLTPTPTSINTNRESRSLFQSLYPMSFGSRMLDPCTPFNASQDTLYLTSESLPFITHFFGILSTSEIRTLRYLAIDHQICPSSVLERSIQRATKEMAGLEKLFIVHELPGLGRSRRCATADCLTFMPHVPLELIGSPKIQSLTKAFAENDWSHLDLPSRSASPAPVGWQADPNADVSSSPKPSSTSPTEGISRVVPVYGWRECHCSDQASNSDSSESDQWTDEDDDDDDDDWNLYHQYGYGDSDDHDEWDSYGPSGMDPVSYATLLRMADEMLDGFYTDDDDEEEEEGDEEEGDEEEGDEEEGDEEEMDDSEGSEDDDDDDDDDDLPDLIPNEDL
ncbi:hypothetical protein HYFRA_00010507 [Hymenoscyphus fraxineus]|uniref:2EXR domain-containing protein n=1 Tax=Hymenoscyphus fraxineus TaxID=746836 RepID=A0A9N9L032_9HELO|nr:hypothetical protein HYFRA_00010507 [Hymenoscyphus fraxineus]